MMKTIARYWYKKGFEQSGEGCNSECGFNSDREKGMYLEEKFHVEWGIHEEAKKELEKVLKKG